MNPIGPRSVYDEAKRYAEAIVSAYRRVHRLETRIVRIFNTYGPRMRLQDGRVVPAFVSQALRGEDFTVFGDGEQTRSFCYVSDLIDGIARLALSDVTVPVNLGNPTEMTILHFAEAVRAAVKELHPYDTPAILVLPIEGGEAGYLDWMMKETEEAASYGGLSAAKPTRTSSG